MKVERKISSRSKMRGKISNSCKPVVSQFFEIDYGGSQITIEFKCH